MLSIAPSIRIFVHALPTDMRKGFNGLCAIVAQAFGKDVLKGDYFVFLNRPRNRCKILFWDYDGLVVWAKKQETDYHRNLVFTGFGVSANNGGIVPLEVGRMVSHSSEPSPRRRPMSYGTEVPIPPRAQFRWRRWRSINSGSG
jgi:hypothetical protein